MNRVAPRLLSRQAFVLNRCLWKRSNPSPGSTRFTSVPFDHHLSACTTPINTINAGFRPLIKQLATKNSGITQKPRDHEEREMLKEKVRNLLKNKEFEMYKAPEIYGRASWLFHFTALAQFIFWGFALDTISRIYADKGKKPDTAVKIRYITFVVSLSIGFVFMILFFPYKMVSKLTIIQKNKDIMAKIENDMKLPFLRTKTIPIKDLHCNTKLFSGIGESGYEAPKGKRFPAILLKRNDQFMGYIFDRGGSFQDPILFDLMFYKPGKK
ncbi:17371_t:CDS:2 [Acaulospora morrowiae]|uniref:17371_t:CDS:1 n=1 Tax=Acaulospora morrowiae TaxID=94023 RepID=A0A9N8VN83_9GLOM|nr:17371_t:CDS:2 [Acaulospora morrowiae]